MSATRRLRMASLGMIVMLILQFILGIVNNLYGTSPTSAQPIGLFSSGWLAVHVILGFLVLITAGFLVYRSFTGGSAVVRWTSVIGVLAIAGAIGAGIGFTRSGANGASLGMSIGFAVALTCYVINLVVLPGDAGARALAREPEQI
jgi:hypothetical protein